METIYDDSVYNDEMTVYYMTVTEHRKRAGVEPLNSSSRNETNISKLAGQEY